jgi:hypothetical protein
MAVITEAVGSDERMDGGGTEERRGLKTYIRNIRSKKVITSPTASSHAVLFTNATQDKKLKVFPH